MSGSVQPGAGIAVQSAAEPAWVRNGSPRVQQDYKSALAFEEVLTEQLTRTMTEASGLGQEEGAEGEGGSEASGGISSLLPQALAGGIAGQGGLGIAAEVTRAESLRERAPQAATSGGTGAP